MGKEPIVEINLCFGDIGVHFGMIGAVGMVRRIKMGKRRKNKKRDAGCGVRDAGCGKVLPLMRQQIIYGECTQAG